MVDFIDLKYFATFNIADSCISCGAVLAVLLVLCGVPFVGPDEAETVQPASAEPTSIEPADETP